MKTLATMLFLVFLSQGAFAAAQEEKTGTRKIMLIEVDGVINPVSAEYIISHIDRAEKEKFHAIILQLDTPGGLLESTRIITKRMLGADVPIITYVAPSGARGIGRRVHLLRIASGGHGTVHQHRRCTSGQHGHGRRLFPERHAGESDQ
ncbi:MAG: hypothetical protein Q9P14_15645 [candidate division KSB1 bacterium]|nr:hypothetical protein [candidate division KSB1 bacterium]